RLEIAVDDALGMRLGERDARLEDIADRFFDRYAAPAGKLALEIGAFEQLDDEVRDARFGSIDVEHLRDMRVIEVSGGTRFPFEPGNDFLGHEFGMKNLQRDVKVHLLVHGLVDHTHPALRDPAHDVVLPVEEISGRGQCLKIHQASNLAQLFVAAYPLRDSYTTPLYRSG